MSNETARVDHNTERNRFEIWLGDERVGLLDYERRIGANGNEIHFTHTEVDPAHQGKNLASILTTGAFDSVRAGTFGKVAVWPVCSYTVMYMQRHPETHDLLAGPLEDAVAACRLPNVDKFNQQFGKNQG